MKGEIVSDRDEFSETLAVTDGTWLFEPDMMMLSTVIHGCPTRIDLTKLIEGEVDLNGKIQALFCAEMGPEGSASHMTMTLINNKHGDITSPDLNWDLGTAIASMDFRQIGHCIILIISRLMDDHDQSLQALTDRPGEPLPRIELEDFMIQDDNDYDIRLENLLKDMLGS